MVVPFYFQYQQMMPKISTAAKTSLARDLILPMSPTSYDLPKHAVILIDGLKEPSVLLLEWVFMNITSRGYWTITLLGVMPWLNLPLSCKTWSNEWMMDIEDLVSRGEISELRNDVKYLKVQPLVDLCRKYGVIPQIKTVMGYPLRSLVAEQIASLHAAIVIVDRHHDRKYIDFYAEKVACKIVAMNDDGDFDLIKGRQSRDAEDEDDSSSGSGSGGSHAPSSKIIYDHWIKYLKPRVCGKLAKE